MPVGDALTTTNTQRNVISQSPGALGEAGSIAVDNNNYAADSWEYLNKGKDNTDNVQLQQQAQQVLPRVQAAFDELNKRYTELKNNPDFISKMNSAKEQYNFDNPPVYGGRYTERTPGVMVYERQIREAKNEANESFQAMKDARNTQEFNAAQSRFNQSNDKLNKLYNTDPSSVQMETTERVVKPPTGYDGFASEKTGWIQPSGESEESYQARQTQQQMSEMLKRFAATGQRPTQDQLQDYANAVVRSGGVVSITQDPALKPFFSSGSSVSKPSSSDLVYKPMFEDVLSKEQIEKGLADPNLTARGRLFFLNEADKLRQNVIGYSSQYHHWANSQSGPTKTNPWDFAGDTALNQQQRSRGITGRSLTQLPSYQDYKNIATNDIINPSTVLANVPITDNSGWLKTISNSNIDKPYQPVQKDTNVAGFNFNNPPAPFLSTIKSQQSVKTGGLGFISLTNTLGNEVNKKLNPERGIPSSNPAQTNQFYPTGQISLNPNDIQTNAPYEEKTVSKSDTWVSNLPVGVGKYGGIIGIPFTGINLPGIIEKAFPTSSFEEKKDTWDLSNIPSAVAPNIISTTKYGKPVYIVGTYTKEGEFVKNQPYTYVSKPMSDVDSKLLTQFNTDVDSFNTDVEIYKMLKQDYESKGSSDPLSYSYLNNQYNKLQERERSLLQAKSVVDKIPPQELTTVDISKNPIIPGITSHEIAKSDLQMAKREFVESTYGKILPEHKHIEGSGIGVEILNTLGGAYNYVRNEPDELIGDAAVFTGLTAGFVAGESLIGNTAAKFASSPGIIKSTIGRAASTPTAMSAGTLTKMTLGGAYLYDIGNQLLSAPNAEGRGKVIAQTGAQVAGIKLGVYDPPGKVDNPYAGREFFSGERKLPQTTQARNYLLTKIQAPFSNSPSAFEDVSTIFRGARYNEPQPGIKQIIKTDLTPSEKIDTQLVEIQRNLKRGDPETGYVFSKNTGDLLASTKGDTGYISGKKVSDMWDAAKSKRPNDEYIEVHTHPNDPLKQLSPSISAPSFEDLLTTGTNTGFPKQVVVSPKKVYRWNTYPDDYLPLVDTSLRGANRVYKKFPHNPNAAADEAFMRIGKEYGLKPEVINPVSKPVEYGYTGLKPFEQPDISGISTIGPKRAGGVTKGLRDLKDSGTVMVAKGSAVVKSQVSGMESGKEAGRTPHDLDMLGSEEKLSVSLKKYGETTQGMDIKQFEAGYPEVPGIERGTSTYEPNQEISLVNKLLGYPIRVRQGEKLPYSDEILLPDRDYAGEMGSEKLQVQAARKAQAVQEDLLPGNEEQYRLVKDSLDFYSINKDLIHANQAKAGIKVGTPTKELQLLEGMKDKVVEFDFIPKQDVPALNAKAGVRFTKKMTFGEMWDAYNKLDNAGKKVFEYTERPDTYAEQLKSEGIIGSSISRSSPSGFAGIIRSNSPSNDYRTSISSSPSRTVSSMVISPSKIQSMISSVSSPSRPSSSTYRIKSPSISSPSPITSPSSVSNPSPSYSPSPSVSPSISPSSISGYLYTSSTSTPSTSPKSPKMPKVPGVPFLAPPGGSGSGGRGSRAHHIRIKNPINPLIAANATTAARFAKTFSGSGMKAFNNVKAPGRGNLAPAIKIKSQPVRKSNTAKSISNNIGAMFDNKKKKKGRLF